jgi:geranylgeranyl reductase family protein
MSHMETYDAIVVGGGPAGSSCAWALQQAGLQVLVLDKRRFPRDKVCAGWITPEVPLILGLDLDAYRHEHTLQPFRGFRTGLLGAPMITTQYGETVSYGILRREFDEYLLKRSGARLKLGESLDTLEQEDADWRLNGTLCTPLLIGAGGHFCPVARRLNPKLKPQRPRPHDDEVVFAQELEFEMDEAQQAACGVQGEIPELYFLPELDGYGWAVRKGRFLNIGLGRTDNHQLASYVSRFHDFLIAHGKAPQNTPTRFYGHAYGLASRRKRRRLIDDGVMLIGDAAGLAYPQSGEGIYTAIGSGLIAAHSILQAKGNYRQDHLQPYLQQLDAFLGHAGNASTIPLPNGLKRFMAASLLKNRYFSRHILLDKWFLHQDTPAAVRQVLAIS